MDDGTELLFALVEMVADILVFAIKWGAVAFVVARTLQYMEVI